MSQEPSSDLSKVLGHIVPPDAGCPAAAIGKHGFHPFMSSTVRPSAFSGLPPSPRPERIPWGCGGRGVGAGGRDARLPPLPRPGVWRTEPGWRLGTVDHGKAQGSGRGSLFSFYFLLNKWPVPVEKGTTLTRPRHVGRGRQGLTWDMSLCR